MLYYQNANEPVNYELIFLNLDRYGEPSTGTIKQNQGKSHRSAVQLLKTIRLNMTSVNNRSLKTPGHLTFEM